MKTTKPNWNMKKLGRMEDAGSLRFDYPIQRKGGQWDELQQSLLIHSIAGDYPIPPILVLKGEHDEKEVDYVLDGKQRTTTVLNFLAGVKDKEGNYPENAYRLHADTPTVELEGTEEPFKIKGLYFDELPEDVQSEIQSASFQIQRLEGATDEEIEELFFRWNNGTPLTKQQKARARMGLENATIIDSLVKHPVFAEARVKFTPLQLKRSDDEAVVLQTLMLMSGMEIESLVADKILQYATDMRDADIKEITDALKVALDYLYESNATSPLFKKLHLPTVLLVAKKASDENVELEVFNAWVEDFNFAINSRTREKALVSTDYKRYTGAGSVKKDKVLGRKTAMLNHFESFVDKYEVPEVEVIDDAVTVTDEEENSKLDELQAVLDLEAVETA
jgi:hypothetical protein